MTMTAAWDYTGGEDLSEAPVQSLTPNAINIIFINMLHPVTLAPGPAVSKDDRVG